MGWWPLRGTDMSNRSGLTALLVLVVVVATVPAGALPAMSAGAGASAAQEGGANASNASLGASVSGFMQANAADAEGEVDDGMFAARFDNTSQERRAALVENRAGTLEQRLERLREQRAELLNGSDGEPPTVADRAKAARLTARIDALTESIDATSEAAASAGVNVTRLEELRRNASELKGSEVAELAGGLAGTERGGPDVDRGKSADRRNGSDAGPNDTGSNGSDDRPSGPDDNPGNGGQAGTVDDGNTSDAAESDNL